MTNWRTRRRRSLLSLSDCMTFIQNSFLEIRLLSSTRRLTMFEVCGSLSASRSVGSLPFQVRLSSDIIVTLSTIIHVESDAEDVGRMIWKQASESKHVRATPSNDILRSNLAILCDLNLIHVKFHCYVTTRKVDSIIFSKHCNGPTISLRCTGVGRWLKRCSVRSRMLTLRNVFESASSRRCPMQVHWFEIFHFHFYWSFSIEVRLSLRSIFWLNRSFNVLSFLSSVLKIRWAKSVVSVSSDVDALCASFPWLQLSQLKAWFSPVILCVVGWSFVSLSVGRQVSK